MELSYDSAIPLLAIYPREMKTGPHKTWAQMVKIAVLIIAKIQKESKCPSTNSWINKMLHAGNGILCGNKKKWNAGTGLQHGSTWKTLA